MRIGVLSSSNGSVLAECIAIAGGRHSFVIATDRPCGTERLAEQHAIPVRRLTEGSNLELSRAALDWFEEAGGVDMILLFYLRIVGATVTGSLPTFNIHPSLLPAYSGLNAVRRALGDHTRFLGASLHLATEAVDRGPIVAQACAPLPLNKGLNYAQKLSFLQKTYLAVVLLELMERNMLSVNIAAGTLTWSSSPICTAHFNPALSNPAYQSAIFRLFEREGFAHLLSIPS